MDGYVEMKEQIWSGFKGDRYALSKKLGDIPDIPGVYVFRDAFGQILYVGKAKGLRSRLRSYFANSLAPKTEALMQKVAGLETIAVTSEVEALILESTLIKKHRPKYNILLRDDKQYPYIRVGVKEAWPRPTIVRRAAKDGARYFGPFTKSSSVKETLSVLRRIFPYRTCTDRTLSQATRPCLDYHIGRCLGPCTGNLSEAEYRDMVDSVLKFLEGRHKDVKKDLEKKMQAFSDNLEYERAAKVRDQINALDDITEKQTVTSTDRVDRDVVGLARTGDMAFVALLPIRQGALIGREGFILSGGLSEKDSDIVGAFLTQYYSKAGFIPKEVLVPDLPENKYDLQVFLSEQREKGGQKRAAVKIEKPLRGKRKDLLTLSQDNASTIMGEYLPRQRRKKEEAEGAMKDLQTWLGLPFLPRRVECYDISNISGKEAVASMVVVKDAEPDKSAYRRFKIKIDGKPNDYAMMQEVLWRRFKRGLAQREKVKEGKAPGKFAEFPDLVLVDGGKGQVSAAKEVLDELSLDLPLAGLAEKNEEIFLPENSSPIILPKDSSALYLVIKARDEAHRFAISYHRKLREKKSVRSRLLEIPGLGSKKVKELLTVFSDVDAIKAAPLEEICKAKGIGSVLAAKIKAHLQKI